MDSKSYALLANRVEWNEFRCKQLSLIPIQLCGEKNRNAIDTMYLWHFCLFPRFDALPVTATTKSVDTT